MARLPTIQDMGARPIPQSNRMLVRMDEAAVTAPARALGAAGDAAFQVGEQVADREFTAMAKERDAYVSDQIRSLLYDPENGFAFKEGRSAVEARKSVLDALGRLEQEAGKDLPPGAKRKLDASLARRLESAKDKIDTHTGGARNAWLDGASNARIEAALQDSIADPSILDESLRTIEQEYQGRAAREGWSREEYEVEVGKAKSAAVRAQVGRIASTDPIAAMQYMRTNQDKMRPSDVAEMERVLAPAVKDYTGQRLGQEALARTFGSTDLQGAFQIAQNTLGMDENAQREALTQYLKDGGVNLDPATTAWCAAFINATLAKAGMEGTGSNLARSFLNWGQPVTTPQRGDIVVLSRGDPEGWQGHVAFFDGYNQDGTLRLLGGNQGNKVSTKGYDPGRVLGFRRAGASNPTSITSALESVLNEPDPRIREAAMREITMRGEVGEMRANESARAASQAAFEHIEAGGSVGDVPLEFRQNLGREAMSSLRAYERSVKSGTPVTTDPRAYLELRQMQAENPAEFQKVDMIEYLDRLDTSTWESFVNAQTTPVDPDSGWAPSTLMSTASRALTAAGIKEEGEAEAQAQLVRWQDQFIAKNGKQPTYAEVQERVNMMMAEVFINREGFGGRQNARMFEIDFDGEPALPDDDMTLDDLVRADRIQINGKDVSQDVLTIVGETLEIQVGREPTAREVMEYLIEGGYYG